MRSLVLLKPQPFCGELLSLRNTGVQQSCLLPVVTQSSGWQFAKHIPVVTRKIAEIPKALLHGEALDVFSRRRGFQCLVDGIQSPGFQETLC